MGMAWVARRLTAAELEGVERDPGSAGDVLLGDDGAAPGPPDEAVCDLDTSWHAVHFALSGTAWDAEGAGAAVLGGAEVGEDLGYGPVRLLWPAEVAAVAAEVGAVDDETLRRRLSSEALRRHEIYPGAAWDGMDDAEAGLLREQVDELRAFYRAAADGGQGVLMGLT